MGDNKQRISELKAVIEQRRVQRSMASLNDPSSAFQTEQQSDSVEESAKAQIEQVGFVCVYTSDVDLTLTLALIHAVLSSLAS